MYKERIMVLPTLNKLISIVSMLLLSMPISGQTLEEKLEELGINMSSNPPYERKALLG